MSDSPEIFDEHTAMLHESLLNLLGSTAVEAPEGHTLGAGLLNPRLDEHDKRYRPRLVLIYGAARWVGPLIGEAVRDDILIIGATREDDPTADMGKIFVACPGTAKEVQKNNDMPKNRDLEEWEIGKLGSRVRGAKPEQTTAAQANLYYERIIQKLGKPPLET
jgi:hypothetical protein